MDRFRSFDGTRIAYTDEGTGPAVVLVHGYGLDGQTNFGPFDRSRPMLERTLALCREELGFAPPLAEPPVAGRRGLAACLRAAGARVILPDLRGFGASDKPADVAAYADAAMARDVAGLIDHLELDQVDVLGFSMGAVTTVKLLALGVAPVRAAVVAGVGDYIVEGEVMDVPEGWPLPDHLPRPLTLRAHAEEGARLLDRGEIERGNLLTANVIMARATGADPRVLAAVLRGTMAEPVPPAALAEVAAPVLVLNGRADALNQSTRRLVAMMPLARAAACEGDHGSTPFEPSFHDAVREFFAARWPDHGPSSDGATG